MVFKSYSVDGLMSLGEKPPPNPTENGVLPLQLYLISTVDHFCFVFKRHCLCPSPPQSLVGSLRWASPEGAHSVCGMGWPSVPPPSPILDASKPHVEFGLGPPPRPEAGRVAAGPWEGGDGVIGLRSASGHSCSSSSCLRVSMKKNSPNIFTMSVTFLFYIGKRKLF